MDYDEAIKFFHDNGNVGRTIGGLKNVKPTEGELNNACSHALYIKRVDPDKVAEARTAIEQYWADY